MFVFPFAFMVALSVLAIVQMRLEVYKEMRTAIRVSVAIVLTLTLIVAIQTFG